MDGNEPIMTSRVMYRILSEMSEELSVKQTKKLQEVLVSEIGKVNEPSDTKDNFSILQEFLDAKEIEGCSMRTIVYYKYSINGMLNVIDIPITKIETDHIRDYLLKYQKRNNCSKVTVDNMRRNLSSFFFMVGRRKLYSEKSNEKNT